MPQTEFSNVHLITISKDHLNVLAEISLEHQMCRKLVSFKLTEEFGGAKARKVLV